MRKNIKNTIFLVLIMLPILSMAHIDNPYLPEGCGSCHVGHGMSNEPMLQKSEEQACYQCHGSSEKADAMISSGKLSPSATLMDIEKEFAKPYRHPVVDGFGHEPDEKLPDPLSSSSRHAECVDCHNPHQRIAGGHSQVKKVSGYSATGQYLDEVIHEYELCFKCHVDDGRSTGTGTNSFDDFSSSYLSQHPVTMVSRSRTKAISLSFALGSGSTLKCTDCHSNDNPNGPAGPHGSNYKYLLNGNYETDPYTDESRFAYEFCYGCHDRNSILSNESFPTHREHILGDPFNGIKGTSCYTCHASHSSRSNENLIHFNTEAVKPVPTSGRLDYRTTGINSGECALLCHGYVHNPARYAK